MHLAERAISSLGKKNSETTDFKTDKLYVILILLQARQFVEMEYTFKGEPVSRRPAKPNSPICTPSGSPLASSLSLAAVCEDACYNRNSYNGKCMKRTRSLSEPSHKHENSVGGEHSEMNDVRTKPFLNSNKTNNNDKRQPNNVTTSAVVTMPDFETVAVPNNIHDPPGSRRYENCNDRSNSHTAI